VTPKCINCRHSVVVSGGGIVRLECQHEDAEPDKTVLNNHSCAEHQWRISTRSRIGTSFWRGREKMSDASQPREIVYRPYRRFFNSIMRWKRRSSSWSDREAGRV